jgi:hypothetical protein
MIQFFSVNEFSLLQQIEGISKCKEDISSGNQNISGWEFILPAFSSADIFSAILQFSKYL